MVITPAHDSGDEIRELFSEYTDMLVKNDPEFAKYLELQNFDSELEHLDAKYGPPDGRLYIARECGAAAGCVGLRRLDGRNCEMKRLYVRPAFRGRGLAGELVRLITKDAAAIGYDAMMLDTLPFLTDAIRLYKNFGFYEIPTYNNSPMDGLVYLKYDLK